eukprot:2658540-Amphidinium_carterae.1
MDGDPEAVLKGPASALLRNGLPSRGASSATVARTSEANRCLASHATARIAGAVPKPPWYHCGHAE